MNTIQLVAVRERHAIGRHGVWVDFTAKVRQ